MDTIERFFNKVFKIPLEISPEIKIDTITSEQINILLIFHDAFLQKCKIECFDTNPTNNAFYFLLFGFFFVSKFVEVRRNEFRYFLEHLLHTDTNLSKHLNYLCTKVGTGYVCGFFPRVFDYIILEMDILTKINIMQTKQIIIKNICSNYLLSEFLFIHFLEINAIDELFVNIFNYND